MNLNNNNNNNNKNNEKQNEKQKEKYKKLKKKEKPIKKETIVEKLKSNGHYDEWNQQLYQNFKKCVSEI
jgi:hypothetical protein